MGSIHRHTVRRWGGAFALLLALSVVAGASVLTAGSAGASNVRFRIVVHRDNPAAMDRAFLADAFLKKTTRWPNGEAIRAVDLRFSAPPRQHFSEQVLKRSVFAIRSYWQQRIFTGRGVPPPELDSDEAVLRHVSNNRGAVGYVSGNAEVSGVRVVSAE